MAACRPPPRNLTPAVAPVFPPVPNVLPQVTPILASIRAILQQIRTSANVARVPPVFATIAHILPAVGHVLPSIADVLAPVTNVLAAIRAAVVPCVLRQTGECPRRGKQCRNQYGSRHAGYTNHSPSLTGAEGETARGPEKLSRVNGNSANDTPERK